MTQTVLDLPEPAIQNPKSKIQNPALVAAAVGLVYLGLLAGLWQHFHGDPLGFAHEGTVWLHPERQGSNGYDGQFYLYIAQHPLHAVQFLDLPSIRLQRIFYPLLIIAGSLGQRALMPYAMLAINWGAVVAGTWLVARLLARWGRSPWFALSYALAAGIPVALQFDTPEPLAFALVALAVTCWDPHRNAQFSILNFELRPKTPATQNQPTAPIVQTSRSQAQRSAERSVIQNSKFKIQNSRAARVAGTAAFAAALLTREHALYFVAAYAGAALLRRDWRGLLAAGTALVPVVVWGAVLTAILGKSSLSELPALNSIPFATYWIQGNLVDPTWRSAGYAAQYIAPAALFSILGLGTLVGSLATWVRSHFRLAPAPLLLALLGNVHLVAFVPLVGYQHQVAASRYALGLALAAVLWAGASRPRWLLWLTPLCAVGLLAYLYGLFTQDPAYLW